MCTKVSVSAIRGQQSQLAAISMLSRVVYQSRH